MNGILTDYEKRIVKNNIEKTVDNQYVLLKDYLQNNEAKKKLKFIINDKKKLKFIINDKKNKEIKNEIKKHKKKEQDIVDNIKKNNGIIKTLCLKLKCIAKDISKTDSKTWVDYFNENIDMIFVINLDNRLDRKQRLLKQFNRFKIRNFEFIKAVNGYDPAFDKDYIKFYTNCEDTVIKSYSRGALGCLKSHIKCIELAIEKEYNNVLIIEDDALFDIDFDKLLYQDIAIPWNLLYLGKKDTSQKPLAMINDEWCVPDTCYASHMWLIAKPIFKILLDEYQAYKKPVDMIVSELSLNRSLGIYALKKNLAITGLQSDLKGDSNSNKWNWDFNKYFPEYPKYIKRIVIWGFNSKNINHSQHNVHNTLYIYLKTLYIYLKKFLKDYTKVEFCNDTNRSFESAIYICLPYSGQCNNLPIRDDSLYIFHLGEDYEKFNIDTRSSNFLVRPEIEKLYKDGRAITLLGNISKNLSLVKRRYSENVSKKILKLDFCKSDVASYVSILLGFLRKVTDKSCLEYVFLS